jgi:hypothetical protein
VFEVIGGSLGDLAYPLIQRCVDLALPILQKKKTLLLAKKGEQLVDNDDSHSEVSIFDAKPSAKLGEGECEILRKLIELVHQAVLKSVARD